MDIASRSSTLSWMPADKSKSAPDVKLLVLTMHGERYFVTGRGFEQVSPGMSSSGLWLKSWCLPSGKY